MCVLGGGGSGVSALCIYQQSERVYMRAWGASNEACPAVTYVLVPSPRPFSRPNPCRTPLRSPDDALAVNCPGVATIHICCRHADPF